MKSKNAVVGESIISVYRLFLIAVIAFVVLGVGAISSENYIDVRAIEADILVKQTINCLLPEGVLDLNKIQGNEEKILDYCGFNGVERLFVFVTVYDEEGKLVKTLKQGDSSLPWVKEIFKDKDKTENILKYKPGDKKREFEVVVDMGEKFVGKLNIEAIVGHEF